MSRNRKNNNDGSIIGGSEHGKDHLSWTVAMDNALLDAMLDEVHKGNRHDGTFTTEAYSNILKVLREQFGPHVQKSNIKNRIKTLRGNFGICKDLFHGLSGFAWNPTTKLFEATREVWDQLIQEKPEAKKWMRTPIHHYDKLYDIYGEDRATGEFSSSARERVRQWQTHSNYTPIDLNDAFDNMMTSDNEGNWGSDTNFSIPDTTFSPDIAGASNASGENTSSRGTKRKAKMVDFLETQYEIVNKRMDKLVDMLDQGNQIAKEGNQIAKEGNQIAKEQLAILEGGRPHCYKEDEIFSELELIGVNDEFQLTAYSFLYKNPAITRGFFGIPRSRRLQFLLGEMQANQ